MVQWKEEITVVSKVTILSLINACDLSIRCCWLPSIHITALQLLRAVMLPTYKVSLICKASIGYFYACITNVCARGIVFWLFAMFVIVQTAAVWCKPVESAHWQCMDSLLSSFIWFKYYSTSFLHLKLSVGHPGATQNMLKLYANKQKHRLMNRTIVLDYIPQMHSYFKLFRICM